MATVDSTHTPNDCREIDGFPGYYVSSDGAIWSDFSGTRRRLSPSLAGGATGHGRGHWSVMLWANRKGFRRYVHRIVLAAFAGPCPEGMEGCHNDGDRDNNHISNLRWDTRKANVNDAERHGQRDHPVLPGERNGRAKMTTEQVYKAMEMLKAGISQSAVGAAFGVSRQAIACIKSGRNWRHLPRPEGCSA